MDAKLSPPSARRRRPWAVRPWTLVVLALLLVAGTLIQACTDNNGTTGPTFACNESPRGDGAGSVRALAACPQTGGKVPLVGDATGGPAGSLFVKVIVSPQVIDRGRRGSVLVNVTNLNGIGVPSKTVILTSAFGNLDAASGTTDDHGIFTTTMVVPCDITPGPGSVSATVDGVTNSGLFAVVTATENNPCP